MQAFNFEQNLRGVGVVLRASLNVPLENGVVTNAFRIEEALPTIEMLSKRGARTTVIAHIGRAKTDSLRPVWEELQKRSSVPIRFMSTVVGSDVCRAVEQLQPGEVLLLENVRREAGEEANDAVFAEYLASYGSVFINDAFSDSHRSHASIVGIPKFIPAFAGPAFMREHEGIKPALSPETPNIAIVGGAKFITKEPLIRTLLEKYDHVLIGGALVHDFFLAKGWEVGQSLVSRTSHVSDLLENPKVLLPEDVVVKGPDGVEIKMANEVGVGDTILDAGPKTLARVGPLIEKARFILWNGPLGNFERGFKDATEALARKIAASNGRSVVGGGDTVASIQALHLNNKFDFVSTAGGAMLSFIADGTLVGIDALK